MGETAHTGAGPVWDRLYETAAAQEGHFTTTQAAEAGYSPQLLAKYLKSGRVIRVRRGVYRLVHFPAGEHEDLVAVWLWTERSGVFSHETALALHGLSDVLPSRVHVTVPAVWEGRRLRTPKRVVLHFADIAKPEQAWMGTVPVTTAARTLRDCAEAKSAPDLLRDAFEEAANRGLLSRTAEPTVISYLKRFYSVSSSRSGPRFRSSSGTARGRQ
jgi:predicted transcriptional regulator of viral defense system